MIQCQACGGRGYPGELSHRVCLECEGVWLASDAATLDEWIAEMQRLRAANQRARASLRRGPKMRPG